MPGAYLKYILNTDQRHATSLNLLWQCNKKKKSKTKKSSCKENQSKNHKVKRVGFPKTGEFGVCHKNKIKQEK